MTGGYTEQGGISKVVHRKVFQRLQLRVRTRGDVMPLVADATCSLGVSVETVSFPMMYNIVYLSPPRCSQQVATKHKYQKTKKDFVIFTHYPCNQVTSFIT